MKPARMRILFVSRAYPPVTGGIENHNAGLARALGGAARLTLVANKRGKRFLPLFLPWAFLRMLVASRRNDIVLLGDGVLAPLGALLKRMVPRARVVCVIHGLDISFATKPGLLAALYARINLPALQRLDLLVAVSRATVEVAVAHGVARERCCFIPNGIFPEEFAARPPRASLETLIGVSLAGRPAIVRVGRYVAHKGVAWFIREVMPRLPADVFFIAAGPVVAASATGDAGCYEDCVRTVEAGGLKDRVRLLTTLRWEDVKLLYATADIVVSPNVRMPGSMEGFGINVIEAAASGATVVAARIDGLQDAIEEGCNGFLVEPADGAAFAARIAALLGDAPARRAFGERACTDVRARFAWPAIAGRYLEEFQTLQRC